ncbi:hypothetical protein N7U66_14015 [Lacinutrix neustonica]|uniref:Uncharacterized protein n=1 Tax=Lacinutrix neustonica TaxID=2980107 RepID=A0A9E8SD22_9FLAO|nr:hypothetical protein [Lacinutrix neustonica]WAC01232.1 hypothetical protein N7U66_14015 [Lacinutrix neustonica]
MLKNYVSVFLICFLFQGTVFAQTPCDSSTGMAGVYPCNDYDLMSNMPISTLATAAGNP